MKQLIGILSGCCLLFVLSCQQKKSTADSIDRPDHGTIHISADESFQPVLEEQIRLYEAQHPDAHILAEYKPEAACMKDFFFDTSNRLVLVTHGLKYEEEQFIKDSLGYLPKWGLLAMDAVAVIVHHDNPDSLFTLADLRARLEGKAHRDQTLVFDGLNATSTYRFVRDSILKGGVLDTTVVRAARNSTEAIDYVSTHPNAIGLVGISWIGNPEDPAQMSLLRKVKIGYVQCTICTDSPYVKPMQESITSHRYPLVRGLYYIIKENFHGLGNGLIDFLQYEKGQLLFRRAYLAPVMDFSVRNVRINMEMPKK
ncbi:MAG TPA: substrate-binding domain-containing protein [Ferruginibacter sp.]|nr:substrate-binding domain-containing protein [Ferruginibacter sp.]